MAIGQMNGVLRHVRRAALLRDGGGMTDGQLLESFLTGREEAAFEVLVRRHGPMVLGVCRRVLHNVHDAEDAFQATFLVLVRKAASLLPREHVGNWLYGVAYHTALKARAAGVRRRTKEAQVRHMSRREPLTEDTCQDWQPLLDQELSRLPDKYREAIVLCDLEGKTRREAARQLGIPEGTLSGRLTTAHRKLARRLAGHGFTLTVGAVAAVLSQNATSAGVPLPLVASPSKAAALLAAGKTAAGVISVKVAALTEGVMKAMLLTKLKMTAAFLVVIGLVAAGSGTLVQGGLSGSPVAPLTTAAGQSETILLADQEPAKEQVRGAREQARQGTTVAGTLQGVDADKNRVTISIFSRRDAVTTEKSYDVSRDAKILRDGKEAKLAALKKGGRATLTLSADQKIVVGITVTGSTLFAPLKSADAEKNTVTITVETRQGKQDRTYSVAKDARVTVDGKEARLADLKAGTMLSFTLSAEDGNTVIQIQTPRRRGGEE
jgi:RNA polymerase sigma factor (sigma-70 family)